MSEELKRWDFEDGHSIEFVKDPKFEKMRSYGGNFMQVYPMENPWHPDVKKHGFFWRCWDAWRPTRRAQRRAKLMRQETPVYNLLWSLWYRIRYSKEHRAKPWGVKMEFDQWHYLFKDEEGFHGDE
jgi:hypothetical protein